MRTSSRPRSTWPSRSRIADPELVGAYAVIWTTTPWTIPANQAIAYGPEVDYHLILVGDRRYLIAEPLAKRSSSASAPTATTWNSTSRAPPRRHCRAPPDARAGRVLCPAAPVPRWRFRHHRFGHRPCPHGPDHGEDDFLLCKAHGIDPVFAVEGDGKYRADWPWLGGEGSVINPKFNAPDGPICTALAEVGGLVAASADYRHSYPHSWRSKAKVDLPLHPQWFVPMDKSIPPVLEDGADELDAMMPRPCANAR
jgi:isoleucyl-tRNA synthetase